MESGNMNMIRKYEKYYIGKYNKINDLRKVIISKNKCKSCGICVRGRS